MWIFKQDRLKAIREMKGLSQRDAATVLGLQHRQQWNAWESGRVAMSVATLMSVVNKMGCSPAFFFEDCVEKNQQSEN